MSTGPGLQRGASAAVFRRWLYAIAAVAFIAGSLAGTLFLVLDVRERWAWEWVTALFSTAVHALAMLSLMRLSLRRGFDLSIRVGMGLLAWNGLMAFGVAIAWPEELHKALIQTVVLLVGYGAADPAFRLLRAGRARAVASAGLCLCALAAAVSLLAVWRVFWIESRWMAALWFACGGAAAVAAVEWASGPRSPRWMKWTAQALTALAAGWMSWHLLAETMDDRLVGRMGLAFCLLAVCACGAHVALFIASRERENPEPMTIFEGVCPACRRELRLGQGVTECGGCGSSFVLDMRLSRCRACGYSLKDLAGERCPECGVSVRPEKDRAGADASAAGAPAAGGSA
ncbi:MAG: hypothetical protein SFZ24_11005 [Planctomycetota bacterium]|nr:hypothetical protein [Planctomycetota bacterium]